MRMMRMIDPDGVQQRQRRRLQRRLYKSKVHRMKMFVSPYTSNEQSLIMMLCVLCIGTQLHMAYGWVNSTVVYVIKLS